MLEAALLWYKTFRKDLEDIGFIFNPYNPCMANRKVQGLQQTILFHVDDLKSSHKMKLVNDRFEKWLNKRYSKHGKVTATCGKVHNYLGMELDYRKQGELKINMTKYVENIINKFLVKLGKKDRAKMPAANSLFNLGTGAKLDTKDLRYFTHSWRKRIIPLQEGKTRYSTSDLGTLCTRVKDPNQADWEKLMRVMKYLNGTKNEYLTLSADDLRVVKWYVGASFAVHPDFKSHTRAVMILGKGAMQLIARKQKSERAEQYGRQIGHSR
jgi:hypothetical protein